MGGWGFLCFVGNRLLAKSPEEKIKRNQNRPKRKSTKIKIVLAKIVKMKIAKNENHSKRKSSQKEIVPQEEKRK